MKCPTCLDTQLVMTDRQSIEIDYCPQCRGVWLDRGELDKLLERSAVMPPAAPRSSRPADDQRRPDFVDSDHRPHRDTSQTRRKSWLSDIFD